MTGKQKKTEQGVSPVVGVMLMLVVTIIIAAVVSAYSGGITSGQKKVPQATIQGSYSLNDGLVIRHMGGDPLALNDILITFWDGSTFGPDVEEVTKQSIDMTYVTDGNRSVKGSGGTWVVTAFRAGDALYLNSSNCNCTILQPSIAPSDADTTFSNSAVYSGSYPQRALLCIKNADNIGKQFTLTVSDKNGNLIGRTDVTVTS